MEGKLKHIRGKLRRWYRRHFRKGMRFFDNGRWYFQEFADIYGDTVNDIEIADKFFKDFMAYTKGEVIVDFLDTDNWDCIRKIEADKKNGLLWMYWRMPTDSESDMIRKAIWPLDYYGLCLKFDRVRFIAGKRGGCFAICVDGYTIRARNVKSFAQANNWDVKIDGRSSFFSTDVIRVKDGISQYWRFMTTPICSFWIIPKSSHWHPQDSKKYLYLGGIKRCGNSLNMAVKRLIDVEKETEYNERIIIKSVGNEFRNVAESLFKLILCFYQSQYAFKTADYDDLLLKHLIRPLKDKIYINVREQERLENIVRIANDLSHDSGNPVTKEEVESLYENLVYFLNDFELKIESEERQGVGIICGGGKPSPREYIKNNINKWCFADEVNEIVKSTSGKISFVIRAELETIIDDFIDGGSVLYKDGYFRNSKSNCDDDALKLWSREEVLSLTEKIEGKVRKICVENGFDTDLSGFSIDIRLKREGSPIHIFTEEEVKELMIGADDSQNNKLVIEENGYAKLLQNPDEGHLYPVSQETWCAGNRYVGKESRLTDLHDSYVLCMHMWLQYLQTGLNQYDDCYISDEQIDSVVEEVAKLTIPPVRE